MQSSLFHKFNKYKLIQKINNYNQKLLDSEQKIKTLHFEKEDQGRKFKAQLNELEESHQNLNSSKSDKVLEENKKLSSQVNSLKEKIEDLEIDIGDYELKIKYNGKEYDKHMEEKKMEKKTLEVDF